MATGDTDPRDTEPGCDAVVRVLPCRLKGCGCSALLFIRWLRPEITADQLAIFVRGVVGVVAGDSPVGVE